MRANVSRGKGRWFAGLMIALVLLVGLSVSVVTITKVLADVGGGSNGSCSDTCSTYMDAWNLYSTGSSGPMGTGDYSTEQFISTVHSPGQTTGRATWSAVKSSCGGKGYNSVWVYEIYGGTKTTVQHGKGSVYEPSNYDDTNSHDPQNRNNSNGENTIESGTAPSTVQGYFSALPSSEKSGWSYGSNVSYFCYNYVPPDPHVWTTSTSTIVQKSAHIGDTVTWTHSVSITNANRTTNININWGYVNGSTNTQLGTVPSGSGNITKSDNSTDKYTVVPGDAGQQICHGTYATGATTVTACVFIVPPLLVHVTGGDLSVGDDSTTSDIMTNNIVVGQ